MRQRTLPPVVMAETDPKHDFETHVSSLVFRASLQTRAVPDPPAASSASKWVIQLNSDPNQILVFDSATCQCIGSSLV